MTERTCVVCAAALTGRQTRYCSQPCATRGLNQARKADGRLAAQRRKHGAKRAEWLINARLAGRYCYTEQAACERCGATFTRRMYAEEPRRYCSARCRADARRVWTGCTCGHCGRAFLSVERSRYCTDRCEAHARRLQQLPATPAPRLFSMGWCRRCSTPFVVPDQPGAYCSHRCMKGDEKDRRRAAQRGAVATVYRRRIFERDQWTCQLCGRKVKRDAVAPHPLSPTIDHIVPLSEGGAHEPANVQCAHFKCNVDKGARVAGAGEQLRLIG